MCVFSLFYLVNILVIYAVTQSNAECPELFKRYSKTHTYCKPANPQCKILKSSISDAEKKSILELHNTYRSKIAKGEERNLPKAANMLQMVWDDELADVAQKHAEQCLFEHDCSSCRRVQNFGVGQNLAIEQSSLNSIVPAPNWPNSIKMWYDEVAYFNRYAIDPFVAPPPQNTYGHFTQLIWASSWRIGCGYVLYEDANMHQKLYTCNYGPAGNTIPQSVYKEGRPCSACPINSCCDDTCDAKAEYAGLCKITDDKAPTYKPDGSYIFYCDFNNQSDCKKSVTGTDNWVISNTLSGSYLGIVLKGGEESSMTFEKKIKPTTSTFCFVVRYRKGPNEAGKEEANSATETFSGNGFNTQQNLPDFGGDAGQQFTQFSMSLALEMETEIKITFAVPPGKPEQFLEIEKIFATEEKCK